MNSHVEIEAEALWLNKLSYYAPVPTLTYSPTGVIHDFNPAMSILIDQRIDLHRNQTINILDGIFRVEIDTTSHSNISAKLFGFYLSSLADQKPMTSDTVHLDTDSFGTVKLKCSQVNLPNLQGTIVYMQLLSSEHPIRFEKKLFNELNHHLGWEQYAISYDKILTIMPYYQEVIDRHFDALNKPGISSILDLGAGTGNITIKLLKAGHRVTAIDFSRSMLDHLRTKVESGQKDSLETLEQNAEQLAQFSDGSFDGVNILLALFDMSAPNSALDESIRVLRPGGTIIVTEPRHCFKIEPLLDFISSYLKEQGLYEMLSADINRVFASNKKLNFNPATREKGSPLRAEVIGKILREKGFQMLTIRDSHFGNCATIFGIKPSVN